MEFNVFGEMIIFTGEAISDLEKILKSIIFLLSFY